ncbi:glyoxalase superfamily protein [Allorhizobium taibaishanense]|uniref:Glyoxalase-related protein domain-containing protein n=1 Tax=Allorhizobium taibaishanense TaxID=887144 RepID=A0A1Q9AAL5_9HYPH|nr:glyoxalase superfamily protein [Allorhizobium taibaishanense]MBB4007116.1 hypothetical protein [Allorhizobium taibaishanense]OLP51904.1 hypothetical protein BJF91_23610 [Allorhizobium taibaishanense]
MHSYRDAKRMAKILENSLREKNLTISHGESLDLIARQFGMADWNILSARLKRQEAADERRLQELQSWYFLAEYPEEFDYGGDVNPFGCGRHAALIHYTRTASSRYRTPQRVFATLMQTVSAVPFAGKRLRVSADLATQAVSLGATIWVRVDQSPGHVLAFDNLQHHANGWLFGDNDWTRRSIVIDVPGEGSRELFFGFFLKGSGSVWAADFSVSIVDSDVSLTKEPAGANRRELNWLVPNNLDFSKTVSRIP